jgi:hypothetical protein
LLSIFMIVLYPSLNILYQMDVKIDQNLFKTLLEYLFIYFLVSDSINTDFQSKIFSWMLIASFISISILKFFMM